VSSARGNRSASRHSKTGCTSSRKNPPNRHGRNSNSHMKRIPYHESPLKRRTSRSTFTRPSTRAPCTISHHVEKPMISLTNVKSIHIACGPTDLRKSIDGYAFDHPKDLSLESLYSSHSFSSVTERKTNSRSFTSKRTVFGFTLSV
jgi:hypothetical protein